MNELTAAETLPRFFVDERIGCIAIRDRQLTIPDDLGLHPDTCGVVRYWMGIQADGGVWYVPELSFNEAHDYCGRLNRGEVEYVPDADHLEHFAWRMEPTDDHP